MTLKGRALSCAAVLLLFAWTAVAAAAGKDTAADAAYRVTGIETVEGQGGFSLMIKGSAQPTFTVYELFDPLRLVIDIADAAIADEVGLPLEIGGGPVTTVTGTMLTDAEPRIAKLEIFLARDVKYSVNRTDRDIIVLFPAAAAGGDEAAPAAAGEIYGMDVTEGDGTVSVVLTADRPITGFTKEELAAGDGKPARFYLDIPGTKAPALARETRVDAAGLAGIRVADRGDGVRIVFDAKGDDLFDYTVEPADTGLRVTVRGPAASPADTVAAVIESAGGGGKASGRAVVSKLHKQLQNAGVGGDEFAEAGYDRQRISVDFYKINLHNVFRLIGEVSGYNMVIDDSVNGTLTLTLDNVPWDFVLDVIMNLKNLQKEERYNTIVISPKSKAFTWPEAKKQELEIKAPPKEVEVDIAKKLEQSPEKLEAKMLLQKGKRLVREGDLKKGLEYYEQAFAKWPGNAKLAKRIAGICLVKLGLNRKAVYYAKKALKQDPEDREAALQVAVGLANMRQGEAGKYFAMAVDAPKPAKAALQSAAAFYEESGEYDTALAMLSRHEDVYGPSLETMVARARVLDKQGKAEEAAAMYRAVLYSGYPLDDDLTRYIKGRIALDNQ